MLPIKSYEKDYDIQVDITFEMNMDQLVISRDGYTILDWLSDIGGIQGIFISALAIFISLCNYNYLDNFLSSKLYKIEKANSSSFDSAEDRTESMSINPCSGLRDAICDKIPDCLVRCKPRSSHNDRGLELGRAKLEKEANIVSMITKMRYFDAALSTILTKDV